MENISLRSLENLFEIKGHCVSVFLPTHSSGHESLKGEDRLTYKTLMQEINKKLQENDLSSNEAEALIKQLDQLYSDDTFWRKQDKGLAVFASPHFFNFFRLPFEVEKTAIYDKHFYLKPLVEFFSTDDHYLALSLSRHGVKLFHGNKYTLERIPLPEEMPESMEEALALDEPDTSLQFHSGTTGQGTIFHGQGMGKDLNDKELKQYVNKIKNVLEKVLNQHREPLILLGLDHITSFYKDKSKYNHIVDEVIREDPSGLDLKKAHKKTYEVAAGYFNKKIDKARSSFHHVRGTGKTAEGIDEVITHASDGMVSTLFVQKGEHVWGDYTNDQQREVYVHDAYRKGDRELLNEAAMKSILKGGDVYYLEKNEMPVKDKNIAATLRY